MAKYISTIKFTEQGIEAIGETTKRARASAHSGLFWQNRRACALVFGVVVCSVVSRSGTHTEVHHGHDSHDVGGSGWLL